MTDTAEAVDRVTSDIPCAGCGYNLRTLPTTGRCPECNLEIATSLGGNPLFMADPAWLFTLRTAVGAQLFCEAGYILLQAIVLLSVLTASPWLRWADYLPIMVGTLFWFAAAFFLTVPESQQPTHAPLRSTRVWLRIAAGAAVLCEVFIRLLATLLAYRITYTIRGCVDLAATVALLLYLRRLAIRVNDRWLTQHVPIAFGGLSALWLLNALAPWVDSIHLRPTMGDPMSKLLAIADLFFVGYGFYVLFYLRQQMTSALLVARGRVTSVPPAPASSSPA